MLLTLHLINNVSLPVPQQLHGKYTTAYNYKNKERWLADFVFFARKNSDKLCIT
jgi:hypothetical protein